MDDFEQENEMILDCPCKWRKAEVVYYETSERKKAFSVRCPIGQCNREGPRIEITVAETAEKQRQVTALAIQKAIAGWNAGIRRPIPDSIMNMLLEVDRHHSHDLMVAAERVWEYFDRVETRSKMQRMENALKRIAKWFGESDYMRALAADALK